jgi:hypothetical protein
MAAAETTDTVEKASYSGKPAILVTGETHPRELISTSFATYEMLKLL